MEESNDVIKANYAQFIHALEGFHKKKITGCVFFTSNTNRSGRLFLTDGNLVNVSYAYKNSKTALVLMTQISAVKYRLGKKRVDASIDPALSSTDKVLAYLKAHRNAKNAAALEAEEATSNLSKEQKRVIESCMLEVIGPMADLIAEEHVHAAKSLEEALTGIKEDVDDKTFALLKSAIDEKL